MSEPVDLDGIEARAKDADEAITTGDMLLVQRGAAARLAREDVPALVAEVRALRAKVEAVEADRLEAKREALREARHHATWPVATAEKWRYDRMLWVFGIMLGEIAEGTPAPPSPSEPGFAAAYPYEAQAMGITA